MRQHAARRFAGHQNDGDADETLASDRSYLDRSYIFSDRKGQEVLELTRGEIVRRLRSGEAVRLDGEPEEPLFDRIMHSLTDKLSAPAKAA